MITNQDKSKARIQQIYCSISGVKFYLQDSIGLQYVAEVNKVHPAFLDCDTMRAILKHEANKKLDPEKLYNKDWQDISLGIESDFDIPKQEQILAKSFIVGVIFAQLADLGLSFSRLSGRQMHELNLALCKHRRRAQLLWWARRLTNWTRTHADKINLSTVYDDYQTDKRYKTKRWSDSLGTYLGSIIEDDSSKLPRLRGRTQASVTVYDQEIAARARVRRAEKPLNGQHIDWGIDKCLEGCKSLKTAKVISNQKYLNIEMAISHWADYGSDTHEKLGNRLIELSNSPQLKQDWSTVMERIGYAFVTGEIGTLANIAKYTLQNTFLGETVEKSHEKKPSLMEMLKPRTSPRQKGIAK